MHECTVYVCIAYARTPSSKLISARTAPHDHGSPVTAVKFRKPVTILGCLSAHDGANEVTRAARLLCGWVYVFDEYKRGGRRAHSVRQALCGRGIERVAYMYDTCA